MTPSRTLPIVGTVIFTFLIYLAIGIQLSILPSYVVSKGFSSLMAGLVISVQYVCDADQPALCRPDGRQIGAKKIGRITGWSPAASAGPFCGSRPARRYLGTWIWAS